MVTKNKVVSIRRRYRKLRDVLDEAYDQATIGKGHVRHDDGEYVENQPALRVGRIHRGFLTGQAVKKIEEQAGLLNNSECKEELLGAIAYLAFEVMLINEGIKLGNGRL